MATFKNAQNGYVEEVTGLSGLWAFLFGVFYLGFKGLWAHVFAQLLISAALYAAFGPAASMFVFVMWVVYAFITPKLIASRYRRTGWIETDAPQHRSGSWELGSPQALDAMGWRKEPTQAAPSPIAASPTTRRSETAATPSQSSATELEKLANLRDKGVLTAEEFDAEKRKVLSRT